MSDVDDTPPSSDEEFDYDWEDEDVPDGIILELYQEM
jgi:hypothetical protein